MAKVLLVQDDVDRHGEGCDCGVCNHIGKSYGVGVYDATGYDGSDTALDAALMCGPLERAYGCSEDAAMTAARDVCAENEWEVV